MLCMPGKSAESESVLYRAVTSPFQSSGHTHNDGESKGPKNRGRSRDRTSDLTLVAVLQGPARTTELSVRLMKERLKFANTTASRLLMVKQPCVRSRVYGNEPQAGREYAPQQSPVSPQRSINSSAPYSRNPLSLQPLELLPGPSYH